MLQLVEQSPAHPDSGEGTQTSPLNGRHIGEFIVKKKNYYIYKHKYFKGLHYPEFGELKGTIKDYLFWSPTRDYTLYNFPVITCLDHCRCFLTGLLSFTLPPFQSVLHSIARMIVLKHKSSSLTFILHHFK